MISEGPVGLVRQEVVDVINGEGFQVSLVAWVDIPTFT